MKRSVIIAAATSLGGPLYAGGPVTVIAEPAPVVVSAPAPVTYDWTGFYVGLSAISGTAGEGIDESDTQGFGAQVGYLRDLGTFVIGGELAYAKGDFDDYPDEWDSTRLKLIGGYDAGRFLPYGFIGLTQYSVKGPVNDLSDTVTIYGLGAKLAISPRIVAGLEYLLENKDDFDGSGMDAENREISLRIDFRF
jgi:hypothetical protein